MLSWLRTRAEHFAVGALLLLAVISHWQWFFGHGAFTQGDWYPWSTASALELWKSWGPWTRIFGMGGPNPQLTYLPLKLLWSFFVSVGLDGVNAIRVTVLWPIALLGFIAPYFLTRAYGCGRSAALLLAASYGLSPYFLIRQTGHMPVALVYALAPLLVISAIRLTRKPTSQMAARFALILTACIVAEVRLTLLSLLVAAVFAASELRATDHGWKKVGALSVFMLIGLNAYWLAPLLSGTDTFASVNEITSRDVWGDHLFDISRAIAAHDSAWTGGAPNERFVPQPIPAYFFIASLLATVGLLRGSRALKGQCNLPFIAMAGWLLFIFLAKQSGNPFPTAYRWLYGNLPGFALFREASKFMLPLHVFLLVVLAQLWGRRVALTPLPPTQTKQARPFSTRGYGLALGLLFIPILASLLPLVSGRFGATMEPKPIPIGYESESSRVPNGGVERTAWMPSQSRWSKFGLNASALPALYIAENFSGWPSGANTYGLMDHFFVAGGRDYLAALGISRYVVPTDDPAGGHDVHSSNDTRAQHFTHQSSVYFSQPGATRSGAEHSAYEITASPWASINQSYDAAWQNGISVVAKPESSFLIDISLPEQTHAFTLRLRETYSKNWRLCDYLDPNQPQAAIRFLTQLGRCLVPEQFEVGSLRLLQWQMQPSIARPMTIVYTPGVAFLFGVLVSVIALIVACVCAIRPQKSTHLERDTT